MKSIKAKKCPCPAIRFSVVLMLLTAFMIPGLSACGKKEEPVQPEVIRPVKTTVSIGNFSGRKCVLKKWIVKIKPVASKASSLWMIVDTLISQPGRPILVKNSGNHNIRPLPPMTVTPQKTAK